MSKEVRGTSQDTGEDRRIILKWIFKFWDAVLDRICLILYRDRWTSVVHAITILRFLQDGRNFMTAGRFVGFSRRTLLRAVSCFIRGRHFAFLRKRRAQTGGE